MLRSLTASVFIAKWKAVEILHRRPPRDIQIKFGRIVTLKRRID